MTKMNSSGAIDISKPAPPPALDPAAWAKAGDSNMASTCEGAAREMLALKRWRDYHGGGRLPRRTGRREREGSDGPAAIRSHADQRPARPRPDRQVRPRRLGSVPVCGRYSPTVCAGARKRRVEGNPDIAHVSTSYVERANLSIRT